MAGAYKWRIVNQIVIRLSDGASIPNDPGNKDWKQFQLDGGVADPADPAPTPAALLAEEIVGAVEFFLNSSHPLAKVLRGEALVTKDELNILRQWDMAFKAAVAASTTLADLKTRVAALPDLADRLDSQIKGAIQNKLNSGSAN